MRQRQNYNVYGEGKTKNFMVCLSLIVYVSYFNAANKAFGAELKSFVSRKSRD